MLYDCGEYADSRLASTYVRMGKDVVWVDRVFEDLTCAVRNVKEMEFKNVLLSELNLQSMPLGYVNTPGGAYFLARIPKRRDWRQGLRENNVNHPFLLGMGLLQPVNNLYPTFKEGLEILGEKDRDYRVAFSRDFAMSLNTLHYRDECVGVIKGDVPTLLGGYYYLDEALKEAL